MTDSAARAPRPHARAPGRRPSHPGRPWTGQPSTTLNQVLAPILALALLLAGCAAGDKHFNAGEAFLGADRVDEALVEYRQALEREPTNARYRIAYLGARDRGVRAALEQAERLRADPTRFADARVAYQRALALDTENFRAREGLAALERDQRLDEQVARAQGEAAKGNTTVALGWLRGVLAERPQHAGALALQTQLQELRNRPKAAADAQLAAAYRKPISLEFRDAQLKQVFEVLSRTSGLNFVLDKDVRSDQRTTLFLRNSTVADAVSLLMLTNQLEQRVLDEHSVLVFPNTPAKVREYQQLSVRAFVLSSSDTKTVSNSLKTLLKARDIVVDEKQNMIIMRDSPEAIELAEKIVALHDQPEAEVMLDVEILEIKRAKLQQMGVQYPSQIALAPMTAASGSQLTLSDLRHLRGGTTAVTGVSVGVQALETNSDVNVLANPRIRSRNREKAKIQVGQRVPNITSTSTSTGFVAETVQYVEVGLKLEVEPTVSPDGEVAIKVGLEVSNILRQVQTKGGSIAYEIGTRNANTVLRLRDGENQVLAGLINDEDRRTVSGLPGLASVPGLGGTVFGNTQNDYQKSEIVLSITPRIIRSAFRPDLAIGEFLSGTESNLRSRGSELGGGGGTSTANAPNAANGANAGMAPAASPSGARPPAAAAGENPAVSPTGAIGASQGTPVATPGTVSATASGSASRTTSLPPPIADDGATKEAGKDLASADRSPEPRGWPSGLSWRGQAQVKVGSTFAVELWAQSAQGLTVIPVALGYDPTVLELVSADPGDFMAKAGTSGAFSKRADPASGQIRAVITASGPPGAAAEGALLRLVFKGLAVSDGTPLTMSEAIRAVSPAGESVVLTPPQPWPVRVLK